jgi:nitrite reductase/ring-hydroxylating ferredoxin subunit/uncharacterized membrane protein
MMRMNTMAATSPTEEQRRQHPGTLHEWRAEFDRLIEEADNFRGMSLDLSHYLHRLVRDPSNRLRGLVDLLHGKPLGHPLHPILTDMTIGSWSLGFLFDLLSLLPGSGDLDEVADALTAIGTVSAIPTALTGAADYSTIKRDAAAYGAAHGMLNGAAFLCYTRSVIARMTGGSRVTALFYTLLGVSLITISAWLGGDLVYRHRVGVNHVPESTGIEDWTPVLALDDLDEATPTRVEVNDMPVVLLRHDGEITAIHGICSHAGGPLENGRVVNNTCIECPWHHSVFSTEDGRVVHAPATYPQPHYIVRIQNGQIEIKSP